MLIVAISLCLDELAHSFRSMQQPSASSSTDEGMYHLLTSRSVLLTISGLECVVVPEPLVEELADLRFAFANLIYSYKENLNRSLVAQENFFNFLPHLFRRAVDDHSFQSHFNTLVEEEVSLFNIFYLKRLCSIFHEDVR